MPIAIDKDGETLTLTEEPFRDENELQACLERCPNLLVMDSEPRVATVEREVSLPAAGSLDLLLVDAEGVPVAVETKLSRNSQSRREVVAQAFDYLSDLTQLTVDELDDIVDGALVNTLDELGTTVDRGDLRRQCGTNLRAGRIKLVVAVDEASDNLLRMVRYINEHSDLDVRLVAISKFDGGRILVPKVLVSGEPGIAKSPPGRSRRPPDPAFEAAVSAYDRGAPDPLRTRGHGRTWRQIRPDDWPKKLHYEFYRYADEIGIELHLESDEVTHLVHSLSALHGEELLSNLPLAWDPRWCRNRGRLVAHLAKDDPPATVAKAMQALIAKTMECIDKTLQSQAKAEVQAASQHESA